MPASDDLSPFSASSLGFNVSLLVIILEKMKVIQLDEATRFIDFCIGLFPQLPTRSSVKKTIKRRELLYNGLIAETGIWMKLGDEITLIDNQSHVPRAYDMIIPIVYEDEHMAVVHKPSGLIVSGNQFRTLVNALVDNLTLSAEPDAYRWGRPVHRLDAATSGLVIVAKTARAHARFGELFEKRAIEKSYCAVVQGAIQSQEIRAKIEDKEAHTQIEVLRSVKSLRNESVSLIELKPMTGRTHQLRIHCAGIGHPIVGDKIYGTKGEVMNHKGLFLCARSLQFSHPITSERMELSIPIPAKFTALMEREKRRWDSKQT